MPPLLLEKADKNGLKMGGIYGRGTIRIVRG